MFKVLIITILLFMVTPLDTVAQDSTGVDALHFDENSELIPIIFDKDIISEYRENEEFNYLDPIQEEAGWWSQFKNWIGNIWHQFWEWLLGDYQGSGFWSFIIDILPYLIIAGIIAFIVWLFIKLNPEFTIFKNKDTPRVFFTEEEEIIKSKNIQALIDKALEKKQYRLAVRYFYLLVLKNLSEASLIRYEFDKTNTDYLQEISVKNITKEFNRATNIYNHIWYGNFQVNLTDFGKAQKTFQHLISQIKKPNE